MNMKKKSGIYMWTSPSGKSYIGQAVDLDKRKSNFLSFGTRYAGSKIDNARRKYSDIQYWTYTILEYCDIDDLDEREEYYISLYDTMRKGYNCESGGNENKIVSDEVKRKLSEAKKGENNPMYRKHCDDETKDNNKIKEIYQEAKRLNIEAGYCKYHVDHIIPLSRGGKHHQDNLQIILAEENLKKYNKLPEELI